MIIQAVTIGSGTYRSRMTVPKKTRLINSQKNNYIEWLKAKRIADIFKNFDENLRTTMETFIYMIKY